MKIYIAGRITGLDHKEAENIFKIAEMDLEIMGHTPVNPMNKVSEQENWPWERYMAEDFLIFFPCDGIYMLANWRESLGARIEHAIAEVLGKHIFYQATELPAACEPETV